jgi:succinate-acetate transporter protein
MATHVERHRPVGWDGRTEDREALFGGLPARIVLQPIAAPSILGLFGFSIATLMVAAQVAGWYGSAATPGYLFPFALTAGGLAQFLAGMWAYRARDGVATAMHGIWGAFWLAYGILWMFVVTGHLAVPPSGVAFPALGFWFIMLAAVTLSGAVASMAENLGLAAVLYPLAAGSAILAAAYFVGSHSWEVVAGWVLVFSAGIAWYVATAMMMQGAFGRTILPLFKYGREQNVPGGAPVRPVEYDRGQPGVRSGQ